MEVKRSLGRLLQERPGEQGQGDSGQNGKMIGFWLYVDFELEDRLIG